MKAFSVCAVLLLLSGCAGDVPPEVSVAGAWARATPPGAPVGAAYLELRNAGSAEDSLVALESPIARVEVHATDMHEGMMAMRKVEHILLPPGQTVKLEPGGMHLMLMDLKEPLAPGASIPLTLKFQRAPAATVAVRIVPVGEGGPPKS